MKVPPVPTVRRNGVGRIAAALEPGKRDLTHDGLALELGDRWRQDVRYVDQWGRWMFWDGNVWREDECLAYMTRARAFLRDVVKRLGPGCDDKTAYKLRQADTVAKVVGLARSNLAQAATVSQWDADPWLLGTPMGTVDLRTGELRRATANDYLTRTTTVAPAALGTPAPLWSSFLERITGGDRELQAYLARLFGYSLTGLIREHIFAFGHGTGANGKSVALNTIVGIMGRYALTIPTEMLMVSQNERHPTEVARLRGVRLAIGSETEDGKRWAEAKIKALTGGDPIVARSCDKTSSSFSPSSSSSSLETIGRLYVASTRRCGADSTSSLLRSRSQRRSVTKICSTNFALSGPRF